MLLRNRLKSKRTKTHSCLISLFIGMSSDREPKMSTFTLVVVLLWCSCSKNRKHLSILLSASLHQSLFCHLNQMHQLGPQVPHKGVLCNGTLPFVEALCYWVKDLVSLFPKLQVTKEDICCRLWKLYPTDFLVDSY